MLYVSFTGPGRNMPAVMLVCNDKNSHYVWNLLI